MEMEDRNNLLAARAAADPAGIVAKLVETYGTRAADKPEWAGILGQLQAMVSAIEAEAQCEARATAPARTAEARLGRVGSTEGDQISRRSTRPNRA